MPPKGSIVSAEGRQVISAALTGRKFSDEHRRNLSLAKAGKHVGNKNPNWRGGDWAHGPEKARVVNAGKHARRHGVASSLTLSEWLAILEAHDFLCAYCFGPFEELDHVIGIASGGTNVSENVVPACRTCNRRKCGANGWVPSLASRFWPSMAESLYALNTKPKGTIVDALAVP